ncbi:FkbM family methyltransferase [Saccharopolyspora thermophila]|uniref:FkbM family methyltransferase n=1 Tax=Saccharopolyspora thermophila TaxID=89367 RepID=UPI00166583FA|nr:FkbM family methyltransferase [Saccharopolyspora subtropica]
MAGLRYVELDAGFGCYMPESGDTTEIKFIYSEIFRGNCYLRGGLALHDDAVVVDVGANVGLFTLYVKQRWPRARVVAIEPMPRTYEALLANLDRHGATGVTPLRRALGARAEPDVAFTYFLDLPGNSTRYPEQKARIGELAGTPEERAHRRRLLADRYEVRMPVERLSDVLAEVGPSGPIDLVKIDIEGSEADALAGIDDHDWARIRQVVLEVQDFAGAPAVLAERGFTVTSEQPGDVLGDLGTQTVYARR